MFSKKAVQKNLINLQEISVSESLFKKGYRLKTYNVVEKETSKHLEGTVFEIRIALYKR